MEQEKTKRTREEEEEGEGETQSQTGSSFEDNKKAKKRDLYGIKNKKGAMEEKGCCSKAWEWDSQSHLAMGVFDFPWLKDGVTSTSEDYLLDFEDNFSSSLEHEDASVKAARIDFCDASMAHFIPEAKLVENASWQPIESDLLELQAEDVDCIFSYLLNKPL